MIHSASRSARIVEDGLHTLCPHFLKMQGSTLLGLHHDGVGRRCWQHVYLLAIVFGHHLTQYVYFAQLRTAYRKRGQLVHKQERGHGYGYEDEGSCGWVHLLLLLLGSVFFRRILFLRRLFRLAVGWPIGWCQGGTTCWLATFRPTLLSRWCSR